MSARARSHTVLCVSIVEPRKIIIGYDGRGTSDDAVALATQLSRLTNAQLLLTFACGAPDGSDQSDVSAEESAKQVLRKGLRALPYGIPATSRRVAGAPAARVLESLAASECADLIVIGSSESAPVGRIRVGSVGQRLMTSAPCGLAVAPRGFSNQRSSSISKIGVCWDGSDGANQALDLAIPLAQMAKAGIHLYTVVNPSALGDRGRYGESIRRMVEGALADACRWIPSDVAAGSEVLQGHPASTLAKQVGEDGVDLLLLGAPSSGYGSVLRVLLRGALHAPLRTAPCPVLIAPHAAAESAWAA